MKKKSISILLPTYHCDCVALVSALQRQCIENETDFEIIVADDGSTDKSFVRKNEAIEKLSGVRYIKRKENVGRSAIRNFLIHQSTKEWLIFIDGDLSLHNPHFIINYLKARGEVVIGGISIGGDEETWKNNLRYRYEKAYERNSNVQTRQKEACQHFRTTNFMARRKAMELCKFDENFKRYGYEDVLLGKAFEENNIPLTHIHNPITLEEFENNDLFLQKTEESLETLAAFRRQLKGYSTLLRAAEKIEKLHCRGLFVCFFRLTKNLFKKHLKHNKSSIFLFNVYKLMYFLQIEHR